MKHTKYTLRKGFTLVELLVVIAIIVALAGLATPAILKQIKEAHLVQATSNARQVYTLMMQFGQDWDTFPDKATAGRIKEYVDKTNGPTGFEDKDSNSQFRQLIAAGYVKSEDIFFTKGAKTKKPDNSMKGSLGLEAGEVGFSYVLIADKALSSSGNAGTPVLLTPMKATEENKGMFDTEIFNQKAVVLRLDGSAVSERLTSEGEVIVGGGKKLLEPGDGTVWAETPTVYGPKY